MILRIEKLTVFRFLCKSAWLTVGTFSVFISSETCTVKTLKYVPFFVKKTQSAPQNRFPLLFLSAKRTVEFLKPFSVLELKKRKFYRFLVLKTENSPFFCAVRLSLLKYKRKAVQNIITIRFALLK